MGSATRVVFEAEASGGRGVRQVVSPTLPFPSPPPFHSIQFSDKPVGGKVRSSEGEVPRLPPTNTTLGATWVCGDNVPHFWDQRVQGAVQ